jgi:hypothetical protein
MQNLWAEDNTAPNIAKDQGINKLGSTVFCRDCGAVYRGVKYDSAMYDSAIYDSALYGAPFSGQSPVAILLGGLFGHVCQSG